MYDTNVELYLFSKLKPPTIWNDVLNTMNKLKEDFGETCASFAEEISNDWFRRRAEHQFGDLIPTGSTNRYLQTDSEDSHVVRW